MKRSRIFGLMLLSVCLFFGASGSVMAQLLPRYAASAENPNVKTFGNLPPLHVEGKWFVDENGNKVTLHGVMDTPSNYFNGGRWQLDNWSYSSDKSVTNCLNYFDKLLDGIANPELGTWCDLFRLHLDPCWTNNDSKSMSGFTTSNGKTYDPNGTEVSGESNIVHFDIARLKTYMQKVYFPIAKKCLDRGMYVIMRPPGVFPQTVNVGDYYNKYLMDVWDYVSSNDSIKKYSGQIMIELGNEPVNLNGADGKGSTSAMHDFFQPIVDKMRENGYTGIILVPGTGYQSSYQNYSSYPITGYNIGYAVHVYSGWYGQSDSNANGTTFINNFKNQVPVVNTNPIVVTEIDWSPEDKGGTIAHYNEFNQPVYKNYGTWATGSTSKWGNAWKAVHDYYGNIGMTLTHPHDFFNIDKWVTSNTSLTYADWKKLTNRVLEPSFLDAMKADGYADAYEASSGACWVWYKDWAKTNRPYMAYTRKYNADLGYGKYQNPILNADFPDPDVIRVGDTFYMVSTTMFHMPGATILKSKDLVNWEYCANPLKQIASSDNYNLQNGLNHYAQGMWASSLNYHNGTFYLYFITWGKDNDPGRNIMLTTTNPEGEWKMQTWNDHYYDSGWLFDDGENGDGNVYVACGIGTISVNKLDGQTLKKISSKTVIQNYTINGEKCDGIEGSHMYHIGDYYYIYATTGGYFRGQQIFRSKDPMGPYEECPYMVFEGQGIHQGALVDTPTGEWWTILFKDAGSIGRVPYLEPVTWKDGWPVIGKNGVDVSKNGAAYTKPNVGKKDIIRTSLPTNDTFTDPTLGMQWEWNHNPDNSAWSLMENPGSLRLHTSGISSSLKQARNSLTQRIFGNYFEGTASTKIPDSYGTVKMNISNMQDGDIAGIAVFQDPYSCIAVKQKDGKRYLYSEKVYITTADGTNASKDGIEITNDVIYLRAAANFGTNKAKYYYSLDNVTWTAFGVEMDMRFVLSVFVGQRFYIFNYATKNNGGFVDVDWFSTEPTYDESCYFGEGVLKTFTDDDLTMKYLTLTKTTYKVSPGATTVIDIVCTSVSGMKTSVASICEYEIADPSVATVVGNCIRGVDAGTTTVVATYTDQKGNKQSVKFTVTVPDDLTMTNLVAQKSTVGITHLAGCEIAINCTAKSGVKTNVADKCVYEVDDEGICSVKEGVITPIANGTTTVTATYTDVRGNSMSVVFTVVVSYFPLYAEGFNPSLVGTGKFSRVATYAGITTAADGFAGWKYSKPLNLSSYKYLILKLHSKQTCAAQFCIYSTSNLTLGKPYTLTLGSDLTYVVDLQNMKNANNTTVNPKYIYYIGFKSNGTKAIYVDGVYLSDDGVTETAIEDVLSEDDGDEVIYNVSGQRLNTPQRGVNIINGKKVFVK